MLGTQWDHGGRSHSRYPLHHPFQRNRCGHPSMVLMNKILNHDGKAYMTPSDVVTRRNMLGLNQAASRLRAV
jgi:hypothetical protein